MARRIVDTKICQWLSSGEENERWKNFLAKEHGRPGRESGLGWRFRALSCSQLTIGRSHACRITKVHHCSSKALANLTISVTRVGAMTRAHVDYARALQRPSMRPIHFALAPSHSDQAGLCCLCLHPSIISGKPWLATGGFADRGLFAERFRCLRDNVHDSRRQRSAHGGPYSERSQGISDTISSAGHDPGCVVTGGRTATLGAKRISCDVEQRRQ
ncbi:hypothetical protein FB567DRAFT_287747 [Paraphoma chrysanthemicola]|uniref:Uncharacterized protein n=1 Tax=Paraphoma chrysanthemicola TaxID=798071 RepID=A0A8K0RDF1_9PLEO|nr:hypothetical protein FB567DRAFT_287747 [Paraphoma chrysanthemicola]